jgi:hypothetical protein
LSATCWVAQIDPAAKGEVSNRSVRSCMVALRLPQLVRVIDIYCGGPALRPGMEIVSAFDHYNRFRLVRFAPSVSCFPGYCKL